MRTLSSPTTRVVGVKVGAWAYSWPFEAAFISADQPSLSLAFGSALCASSRLPTPLWAIGNEVKMRVRAFLAYDARGGRESGCVGLLVAVLSRVHQRGPLLLVLGVGVGLVLQQQIAHAPVGNGEGGENACARFSRQMRAWWA